VNGTQLSTIIDIKVCPSAVAGMLKRIGVIDAAPGTYLLRRNNCAQNACSILEGGGITIGGLTAPQTLMDELIETFQATPYEGYTNMITTGVNSGDVSIIPK
jgi:hypothetical protein